MFRFRVESHISIMLRDLCFDASVGIDGAVSGRSSGTPVRRARELAVDLEQYTTHAELLDLHAILDRYDDNETAEIHSILAAQARNRAHQFSNGLSDAPP
jgi:hypothetical protein